MTKLTKGIVLETSDTTSAQHRVENPQPHPAFDQFVATISALRAPDGCPWDQAQTHASIAKNMIEEAYEAVDAIEQNDVAHLREELGDVLLQVVLQSQIAADAEEFTIDDVASDVNAKMIRRHPHVFGDAQAEHASDVLDLWDQVKLAEGATEDKPSGLLESVPSSFPALMQAQKLSRKAASAGFEWDSIADIWDKVGEEIAELKEAYEFAPKTAQGKVDTDAPAPAALQATGMLAHQAVQAVEMEFGDVFGRVGLTWKRCALSKVNVSKICHASNKTSFGMRPKHSINFCPCLCKLLAKYFCSGSFVEVSAGGLGKRTHHFAHILFRCGARFGERCINKRNKFVSRNLLRQKAFKNFHLLSKHIGALLVVVCL